MSRELKISKDFVHSILLIISKLSSNYLLNKTFHVEILFLCFIKIRRIAKNFSKKLRAFHFQNIQITLHGIISRFIIKISSSKKCLEISKISKNFVYLINYIRIIQIILLWDTLHDTLTDL